MDYVKSLFHRHVSIKARYNQHQNNMTLRTLGGATEQIMPIVSPFHYSSFPVPAHQLAQTDPRMALGPSASTSELGGEVEARSKIGRLSNESDMMEDAFDPFSSYLIDPALYNASFGAVESGDEASYKTGRKGRKLKASAENSFAYAALNYGRSEFRTLALSPARQKEDDVHCTLIPATLTDERQHRAEYEALSYVWGDAGGSRCIYVNDHAFPVTSNLDVALRYLRSATETRLLWIDAICIDQNNSAEKAGQVGMMRDIYAQASRVLVWLGQSDRDIREAMAFVDKAPSLSYPYPVEAKVFKAGLAKVFERSWWSRMWVVQEVIAATDDPLVGCGRKWVPWSSFQVVISGLGLEGSFGAETPLQDAVAIYKLSSLRDRYITEPSDARPSLPTLEDLLTATCDRKTSQPHDKVYALLGLTESDVTADIEVDYSRPFSDAFQKAMCHVLKSSNNLNFLVQAMNPRRCMSVPSWCVDFSEPNWNRVTNRCEWLSLPDDDHGASRKVAKPSSIAHDPQANTLRVSATILGGIQYVQTTTADAKTVDAVSGFLKLEKRILASMQSEAEYKMINYGYTSCIADAAAFSPAAYQALKTRHGEAKAVQLLKSGKMWETFNKGMPIQTCFHGLTEDLKAYSTSDYSMFDSFLQTRHDVTYEWVDRFPEFPKSDQLKGRVQNLIHLMGKSLAYDTLFTTDTGHLGRATSTVNTVEEGDVLCIIHGCRIPAILRSQGDSFKLLTFAYVADVMEGQYFDDHAPGDDIITLC